ncbi:MAG: acyl-CoA dehydrogenase family protein [Phycisphaerae bacterium]
MNYDLPDELIGLQEMTRKFAAEHIAPHARQWDRENGLPPSLLGQMAELGFLGLMVPEELDGAGLNYLGLTVVMEEIARHCGGTALMVAAHNGLCCGHLLQAASVEQKKKYLPPLAKGEMLGSWGLTESCSGSDAAALKTTAVKDGGVWVINGDKMFITNGDVAGLFVILARTNPQAHKTKGISAFIVERDTKGLHIGPKEDKLGMRASGTVPLTFEDMRVPEANLCGQLNNGFHDTLKVLERGRIGIGALSTGLGRGALDESVAYAKQREQFGKPLAGHQAIQFMLADMAVGVDAARLLVRKAAMLQDMGQPSNVEASQAKLFASEIATKACLDAIQIHGGYGYLKDVPVERYLRDAKLCEIGEGSSQVQRMIIARAVLEEAGG